ncbi:MAG: VCBS repeat-containing protein [Acidobacteriia bacterium]|nr:VCBS repeat-containing protein [Terriglobia bacterium]
MRLVSLITLLLAAALAFSLTRPPDIPFQKHVLDSGANESCAIADINLDGKLDIVSGENWFAAPKWIKTRFRDLNFNNNYIDGFSDLMLDVNGDRFPDIITATWFDRELSWWQNPGKTGAPWKKNSIEKGMNIEFAFLVDLDNDGKAQEVLPQFGGANAVIAWYEVVNRAWVKHQIHNQGHGHGIGAGDVNGDGRSDILTPKGWFESPANPRQGEWTFHPDWEHKEHLGFLYVNDVNGDGLRDIVSSHAHDYGLFWMERGPGGKFTKRLIDDTWSQAHATALADLNGDGKLDLLSGKRYMAHEHENGAREPLGIYWYETLTAPGPDGKPRMQWVRHVIDFSTRAGGGMQMPVADIDGDGDLDFAAGGKLGVFLFENKTR